MNVFSNSLLTSVRHILTFCRQRLGEGLAIGIGLGLCSCGLTPSPPILKEAPSAVLENARQTALDSCTFTNDDWPAEEWWRLFGDPQLDMLILQAIADNPSIVVAEARVHAALAASDKAHAPMFPTLDFESDVFRMHNSKNGIVGLLAVADPLFPLTFLERDMNLLFSYQFDFWKKNRNQIIASLDEVQARKAEAYAARLTLALSVAESYFQLHIAKAREKLAQRFLANRQAIDLLMHKRQGQGLENIWNVNKAQQAALAAQKFLYQTQQEVLISNHELQALLADDFAIPIADIEFCQTLDRFPIPCSLPLDLLAHRPDVWAQRFRLEAAARLICVAKADFYPNIDISGLVGLQAIQSNPLFSPASYFGLIFGPALHLPIFKGGALQAEYDLRSRDYDMAVGQYDAIVLTAVKEVLNALTMLQKTTEFYQLAITSEEISRRNLEVALARLRLTLNSRMDALSYENEWLQAEDARLQALLAGLQARLNLILALGGGFDASCENID